LVCRTASLHQERPPREKSIVLSSFAHPIWLLIITKLLVLTLKDAIVGTAIVTLSMFILMVARIRGSKWLMGSNFSLFFLSSGNLDKLQFMSECNANPLALDPKNSTIHCTCVERFGMPLDSNANGIVRTFNFIHFGIELRHYHQFLMKEYWNWRLSKSTLPPVDFRIKGKIKLTGVEVNGGRINFNVNISPSCTLQVLCLQPLH
jgi:hypothetical protein